MVYSVMCHDSIVSMLSSCLTRNVTTFHDEMKAEGAAGVAEYVAPPSTTLKSLIAHSRC